MLFRHYRKFFGAVGANHGYKCEQLRLKLLIYLSDTIIKILAPLWRIFSRRNKLL